MGFRALPAGHRYFDGYFFNAGYDGCWWSPTENSAGYAWYRDMISGYPGVGRTNTAKPYGFSTRCLQDSP